MKGIPELIKACFFLNIIVLVWSIFEINTTLLIVTIIINAVICLSSIIILRYYYVFEGIKYANKFTRYLSKFTE